VWKESPNGEAERQLAGDERATVLTLVKGKKWRRGKISPVIATFYRGRRGRVGRGGSPKSASSRTGEWVARAGFPCPGSLTGGPTVGISKWCEPDRYRVALFRAQLINNSFLYFPK
jgi:hypothetical protein